MDGCGYNSVRAGVDPGGRTGGHCCQGVRCQAIMLCIAGASQRPALVWGVRTGAHACGSAVARISAWRCKTRESTVRSNTAQPPKKYGLLRRGRCLASPSRAPIALHACACVACDYW